jgi:predicted amidohydrolase
VSKFTDFTLAAVQAAPVYFDREASTDKACRLIEEAGVQGASLAAFGETWLPGYPFFVWTSKFDEAFWEASAEYVACAVEIPGPTTDRLCAAAKKAGVDVVIGVVERDRRTRGTVYCTLLFIGNDGSLLGRHRKLKPTHRERTLWGEGDGSGLTVYERPYGRVSGLNCWEHNMLLPGYSLMCQGTQIHVAAWPGSESGAPPPPKSVWGRQLLLSRAFASQAGAYVILAGGLCDAGAVPERYRPWVYTNTGDSCIIDPRGEVIAGPAEGETILVAEGSTEHVYAAKSACDVGGHYSRPDVFRVYVNRAESTTVFDELMDFAPSGNRIKDANDMTLSVLREPLAVCRLGPDAALPAWALEGDFSSVIRTADELSVICEEGRVPADVRVDKGWRALKLNGPFDLSAAGVLAPIVGILARAEISVLPLATFDTDYVLVREDRLTPARGQLEAAGYRVLDG